MNKYTCTLMSISDIVYATLTAESDEQAREMAMAEATKRGYSPGRARSWSVRVLEEGIDGPAQIIDCGNREA
jgi:hypothetical protein